MGQRRSTACWRTASAWCEAIVARSEESAGDGWYVSLLTASQQPRARYSKRTVKRGHVSGDLLRPLSVAVEGDASLAARREN